MAAPALLACFATQAARSAGDWSEAAKQRGFIGERQERKADLLFAALMAFLLPGADAPPSVRLLQLALLRQSKASGLEAERSKAASSAASLAVQRKDAYLRKEACASLASIAKRLEGWSEAANAALQAKGKTGRFALWLPGAKALPSACFA